MSQPSSTIESSAGELTVETVPTTQKPTPILEDQEDDEAWARIKDCMAQIRADFERVRMEMEALNAEIQHTKEEVEQLEDEVAELKVSIAEFGQSVDDLRSVIAAASLPLSTSFAGPCPAWMRARQFSSM